MKTVAYLDISALALLPETTDEDVVIKYIERINSWNDLTGKSSIRIITTADAEDALISEGLYPPFPVLADVMSRCGIDYVQPHDVQRIVLAVIRKAEKAESISGVEDIDYDSFGVDPDIGHLSRRPILAKHFERIGIYMALCDDAMGSSSPHSNLISCCDENSATSPVNMRARLTEVLAEPVPNSVGILPRDINKNITIISDGAALASCIQATIPDITSVSMAVALARESMGDFLIIGRDVQEGVSSLHTSAGPPAKILDHLQKIRRYCERLQNGDRPGDVQSWLRSQNVDVSSENAESMNNADFSRKRTWDDGSGRSVFSLHTRPNNHTSANRCVRIYFKISASGKASIGWIGQKPG